MSAPECGPLHTLLPGDVICADRGECLETLLGSCVAVVLTDARRTVGAMCHIVHASAPREGDGNPGAFAGAAIDALYAKLIQRGFSPRLCQAYVYGGGNMFPRLVSGPHVGRRNAESVLERLRGDGVRIIVTDLGGTCYRRLRWTVGDAEPELTAVEV
jgi:chemotaxis protein CheD